LKVGQEEKMPKTLDILAGESREDIVSHPSASYIAVYFSHLNLREGDVVIVRAEDGSVSYKYTGLGRGNLGNAGGFFSSPIPGKSAIIEYYSAGPLSSEETSNTFGYTIDKYVRGAPIKTPLSICGDSDDSLPAKCYEGSNSSLPLAYERAQAVARLFINSTYLCTGWLVGSEGHLMTNNHCVSTEAGAAFVDVEFEGESASCTEECKVGLGCRGKIVATSTTLIATSKTRDYALLKLPADAPIAQYKYLKLRPSGPELGEEIYIPQHPRGWAKRIASVVDGGEKAVIKSLHGTTGCGENQVGYIADTQGGSSGSPVLSTEDNTVIALHHCGGCENTGVDITDVIADLKEKNIEIKDWLAPPSSKTPTPAPSKPQSKFCAFFNNKYACKATFFCNWDSSSKSCGRRW
jgi:hypothetical protein